MLVLHSNVCECVSTWVYCFRYGKSKLMQALVSLLSVNGQVLKARKRIGSHPARHKVIFGGLIVPLTEATARNGLRAEEF